tara:strand:+ start:72979 stop:73266 length:288 start_codon:yes stop_codon:yes gene_type:complete
MSLHNDIMNIQNTRYDPAFTEGVRLAMYNQGHKDARHSAAELALTYEKREAELERLLEWALDFMAKNPPKKNPIGDDFKNLKDANDILDRVGEYK